ncbi:MAG TPA: ABC transporter substrate-binding protein [Actinomadura sp.]|jgi:NitT/TauT family transport system substrate-binding protein|nr:ABC transporter substrate-binding protein [Actinomadura sp.]
MGLGMRWRPVTAALAVLTGAGALTACGSSDASGNGSELRLGYFPNITHATALVGVRKGFFTKNLGSGVELTTATFNAGPAATEALFSGAIDATYIGPSPSINAWSKSHGKAVKIISGAASGGASLVVRPSIRSVEELRGKTIATPQLGNTQDVALRHFLRQKGLKTDKNGGGDVKVRPQDNSVTLQSFAQGAIDGAWVPEPHASRLVLENKGKRLVNENDLWPGRKFVITNLLVRTEFLKAHPDLVKKLIKGSVEANEYINAHPAEARKSANDQLAALTGKPLKDDVSASSFKEISFTDDPVAASLRQGAAHAREIGLLDPVDLRGIYDLGPLNEVLKSSGKSPVSDS